MPCCYDSPPVTAVVDSRSGSGGGEGCYRQADRQGWRWQREHTHTHRWAHSRLTASYSQHRLAVILCVCVCVCVYMSVCVYVHARQLKESERQHSRVLKQLRALIRLQAEISLDDKNSGTGLEEVASRAAGGGMGSGVTGNRMVYQTRAHIRHASAMVPGCPQNSKY